MANSHIKYFYRYNLLSVVTCQAMALAMDRVGRRPVLALILFGLAADAVICAVAPTATWLVWAHAAMGLLGGVYPFLVRTSVLSLNPHR